MLKSCKYCGRIHDSKVDCGRKPVFRRKIKGNEKIRYTKAMATKSEDIKRKAKYLCEVCFDEGVFNYNDLETHHIIKLIDEPDLALVDLNLICLCRKHHEKAEKGEISAIYLRKLAEKREKQSPLPF